MMRTSLPIVVAMVMTAGSAAARQAPAPGPPAPIAAAKDASAKVAAAQQKNAEALDPKPAPQPPAAPAAGSQPPAATPAPQAASPAAAPGQPQAPYTYDPKGRRDPFVNLLVRGGDVRPPGAVRPSGLPGLLIGDLSVKGIVKAKASFVAILQAADNKTYIVHPGDRVLDGTIKSITQDAVVFSQDVNDPLSLVKQREVRKTIRPETR